MAVTKKLQNGYKRLQFFFHFVTGEVLLYVKLQKNGCLKFVTGLKPDL